MSPTDAGDHSLLAEAAFQGWMAALRELTIRVAPLDGAMRERLSRTLLHLREEGVVVVFGGHFKSGKSSAINAALGRRVLPVDDLPETGAICVLRSAEIDFAQVRSGDAIRPIPFTPEAIQEVVSLIGESGQRRTEVHGNDRVELTLAECPIPRQACWVDTPGINDAPEMDARAREAAGMADVLVWILGSRALLSEAELLFLAPLVMERGPAFVHFVVNAFLRSDVPEEWETFLREKLPRHQGKIEDGMRELGYPEGVSPEILVVSGRAIGAGAGDGFGGAALRGLLSSLSSGEQVRVRQARLGRASLTLRAMAAEIEAKLAEEGTRREAERQALDARTREADERRRELAREITAAVGDFFDDWTARARAAGAGLAASSNGSQVSWGDSCSLVLNAGLKSAAGAATGALVQRIAAAAQAHSYPPPVPPAMAELQALLAPPDVWVRAPESAGVPTGAAAAVGGLLRSVGGERLGAAVGGFFGGEDPAARASRVARELQAAIRNATEDAVAALNGRRQAVMQCVLQRVLPNQRPPAAPAPDESLLRRWQETAREASRLADLAWSAAVTKIGAEAG
jgi:hypothetical protein